jgi:hypothetical protein
MVALLQDNHTNQINRTRAKQACVTKEKKIIENNYFVIYCMVCMRAASTHSFGAS